MAATTSFENSVWTSAPESLARTLFPIAFSRWRTTVTCAIDSRAFRSLVSTESLTTNPCELPATNAPTSSLSSTVVRTVGTPSTRSSSRSSAPDRDGGAIAARSFARMKTPR